MTLIYFLLILSVIVIIHEGGHLLAAKMFGVYCYEFSIGMGPVIWKKKTKETQYSLRAFPIGGFVAMAGSNEDDEAHPDQQVPEGRSLNDKPLWQKLIIYVAGVFMNIVLAWVVFSMIMLANGAIAQSPKPYINSVREGYPAEAAGMKAGDLITKITKADGTSFEPKTFSDIQVFTAEETGEMTYTVLRGEEELTFTLTPQFDEESQSYLIGITSMEGEIVQINLLNCWFYGFQEMGMILRLLFSALSAIFHGSGIRQFSGPVGIYKATETYSTMGFSAMMFLLGQLSLNVGIMNLLPLPVLDGGQIVISIGEKIAGRELNQKVKTGLFLACWVLLLGFIVMVTWQDINRYFG